MTKISLMMEVDLETLARISAVLSGAPETKPAKPTKETAAETQQQQQQPQQQPQQQQPQQPQQQQQPGQQSTARAVSTEELTAAVNRAMQRIGADKTGAVKEWLSANYRDAAGQPIRSLSAVAPDTARVDLLDKLSKIADGSLTI